MPPEVAGVHALLDDTCVRVEGPAELAMRVRSHLPPAAARQCANMLTVRVSASQLADAGRVVLEQPPVTVSLTGDDIPLITASGVSARIGDTIGLSMAAEADRRMLRAVIDAIWPLALPRFGVYHLHGGAVQDPRGTGWLLAGDAGAGKSTTVLSLAVEGWRWTSDDATYVRSCAEELVADGWREHPRLSARSAAALRMSREDHASPWKTDVALPPAVMAARLDRILLHRVLLPELGSATRLDRLAHAQVLDGLLRASAWLVCLPGMASSYLQLLARLATLPAWRMILGPELLDEPALASRMLLELDG
jgi:hypothetical protein